MHEMPSLSNSVATRIPSATYRLQFQAKFTFSDAVEILEYLDELGITDIYASPYFQSSPTSTHGYDVADHNRLNPAIGDTSDFRKLVFELHRRGMGQVLDFVPNHMGIGESLNRWWMATLEDGICAEFSNYFDIDWHPGREALDCKIVLPILGDRYGKVLESGELRLKFDRGGFYLQYYQTKLPINPRSYPIILTKAAEYLERESREKLEAINLAFANLPSSKEYDIWVARERARQKVIAKSMLDELVSADEGAKTALETAIASLSGKVGEPSSFDVLHELLESQVYRLSYWRVAAEEINYRRFFDINTLAAIRVEIPEVFDAAHHFVFELLARGDVTGLRIDHIDGLWDPEEYLSRLQERYGKVRGLPKGSKGLYLVVEKILDPLREHIPDGWAIHGTTGYEFANQVVQVLIDSDAEDQLTKIYQRFTGETVMFSELVYEKKLLTMEISLWSEIASLGRELNQLSELHRHYRDFTPSTLTAVVREVIACFPVYRSYISPHRQPTVQDERVILHAISAARRRNPSIEKSVFDFLRNILLLRLPEGLSAEHRDRYLHFAMRFQQCTGPVMAKGMEDTALYVANRLIALNEVGGNPGVFGMLISDFHRLNIGRSARMPHSLLATTTHDTKRNEDVRMRIAVISERPDIWRKSLYRWSRVNQRYRVEVDGEYAPSRNEEYALYQTLLGTWPLEPIAPEEEKNYLARIQQYMLKALKEAKVNSSWTVPNEAWEAGVSQFIEAILDRKKGARFLRHFVPVAEEIARFGAMNSLAEVVLKCTVPGVPDIYQGTEIWDFSLVDPDNRRDVDYKLRKQLLASLVGASPKDLLMDWKSGRIKLFVIQKLLRFRRSNVDFFREASYEPLELEGGRSANGIAFLRKTVHGQLAVIVPRLTRSLGFPPLGDVWEDTHVALSGDHGWTELFTGRAVAWSGSRVALKELFSEFPLVVLYK